MSSINRTALEKNIKYKDSKGIVFQFNFTIKAMLKQSGMSNDD